MNILIVKLSSLGDVVHTMAAVQDLRCFYPHAQIDWVVESSFAPLVRRCSGVTRVIECQLRRWRRSWWQRATRCEMAAFATQLRQVPYDAVFDLQGLTKSALVARLARLRPGGKRYALANQTDGSSYEAPTRWLADVAVQVQPHIHAVQRARVLCAQALSYGVPEEQSFGLLAQAIELDWALVATHKPTVALLHGASRADKLWPLACWIELGQRLNAAGYSVALAHGSQVEHQRSQEIAACLQQAVVWPAMPLDALTDALAECVAAVGVDSGLSHIAVALNLPHVQLYNFDTAWRTGPQRHGPASRQFSVFAQPTPRVDEVWQAWQQAMANFL